MLRWYPGVLLRVLLELTFAPIALFTTFVVMVLCADATPWRMGAWSGPGATADFWKVVGLVAIGWTLLALGWRGARRLFRVGILVWHGAFALLAVVFVLGSDGATLSGEAIGFRVSLGVLAPLYTLLSLGCALAWFARDRKGEASVRRVAPLRRRNRLAASAAIVLLGTAAICFTRGVDEAGVLIALAGTIAAREFIRPLDPSAELHRALVGEGSALE